MTHDTILKVNIDYNDSDVKKLVSYIVSGVIGILFMGNIFFITKLVSRIETIIDEIWSLRQQITILTYRVDEIQKKKE